MNKQNQQAIIPHIIRAVHDKDNPFVMLNKQAARDPNLSLEAVGLWTRLFCNKDIWTIHVTQLMEANKCGKHKIYRILKELIKNGYAFHDCEREKGKFKKGVWFVFETKRSAEEIKKMFPYAENPYTVKPDTENQPLIENNTNIPSITNVLEEENNKKREETHEASAPSPIFSKSEKKGSIQREPEVFILPEEHKKLVDQHGIDFVEKCYKRLSNWKIDTPKAKWKKNDYRSILRWVVDAVKEDELKAQGHSKGFAGSKDNIPVPKDVYDIFDENKAVSERIMGIVKDLCSWNIYFTLKNTSCFLKFGPQNFEQEYFYSLDTKSFKQKLIHNIGNAFPEIKEKLKEI